MPLRIRSDPSAFSTPAMSSDREHLFFETSPMATLILSPKGTISRANRAATRILAASAERLVGRPVLGMVVDDDRERVKTLFLRVLQGQQREWTARFRRGDGAPRVQWVRAVPVESGGSVQAIVLYTRDVTEGRDGRPETIQLQGLLECLPGQFTLVLDRQGRIRYASGLSRTHFRGDAEIVGESYADLLSESLEVQDYKPMLTAARNGDHWAGLHWHVRVDGSGFPAHVYTCPYRDPRSGRILGVLLAGRDHGPEREWRDRAQKAEGLAGLGEIVGDVAAELSAGLDRLQPSRDSESVEVDRMRLIVHSLRDLSTAASMSNVEWSLSEIVEDAIQEMGGVLEPLAARVDVEEPEGPVHAEGDRTLLLRLFEELIANALETLADEADPAGRVRILITPGTNGAIVHVVNPSVEGGGEAVHEGFEALFSTKPGRAGLGLTVVRTITQLHGGRVWSEQDAQGRLVFCVLLPFSQRDAGVPFHPEPLCLTSSSSVLIVDDEERVRTGLRRFLEKVGFDVREAWSGRSALAQITAGHPPEVVLTDLRMSDGSGRWFLTQLARDFPDLLRHTLIITGDPDHAEIEAIRTETGCPVLSKPVELPELLERMDEVSARH